MHGKKFKQLPLDGRGAKYFFICERKDKKPATSKFIATAFKSHCVLGLQ